MKILFVGHTWFGSDARGLKEALQTLPNVILDDIGIDLFVPDFGRGPLRIAARLIKPVGISRLRASVISRCIDFEPDVIVIVKGEQFDAEFVRSLRTRFAPVVNVFPDASPHIFGSRLRASIAEYNLVISRKTFHPVNWKKLYGYDNECVHVPHGYSPSVHLRNEAARSWAFDLVLVGNYREEYELLVDQLAPYLETRNLRFVIGGSGWNRKKARHVRGLEFVGGKPGAAYTEWLRRAKIVLAPVQTVVIANGLRQPGDQVTARTFQCAAAYTFFIHKRSDEVKEFYDEQTELPMYEDGTELADKIDFYLSNDDSRLALAKAAHERAVPAYSLNSQVAGILEHLKRVVRDHD